MKIGVIRITVVRGASAMLGLVAGTRGMTPSSWADAGSQSGRQSTPVTAVTEPGVSRPTCGPEEPAINLLLAQADAKNTVAQGEPTVSGKKPNIVVIMGDDVGWFNIGAYHRGIMAAKTPNLDRLAAQGMLFTDSYAEASCTAGRANFITGQLPIRTPA